MIAVLLFIIFAGASMIDLTLALIIPIITTIEIILEEELGRRYSFLRMVILYGGAVVVMVSIRATLADVTGIYLSSFVGIQISFGVAIIVATLNIRVDESKAEVIEKFSPYVAIFLVGLCSVFAGTVLGSAMHLLLSFIMNLSNFGFVFGLVLGFILMLFARYVVYTTLRWSREYGLRLSLKVFLNPSTSSCPECGLPLKAMGAHKICTNCGFFRRSISSTVPASL